VRTEAQLDKVDALVIPGGESTTMLKLLRLENLLDPLRSFAGRRPIFGTCAGAILMASEVTGPYQESLNLMDITVERNAYGRQLESRVVTIQPEIEFERRTRGGELETVFIRAPIIRCAGDGVRVLARYQGDPVLVEQGRHMAATFHPELSNDERVHWLFLEKLGDL
jgi:5'-phosphate synthase pdxT subunit